MNDLIGFDGVVHGGKWQLQCLSHTSTHTYTHIPFPINAWPCVGGVDHDGVDPLPCVHLTGYPNARTDVNRNSFGLTWAVPTSENLFLNPLAVRVGATVPQLQWYAT